MNLVIDGYNLLYCAGILAEGNERWTLEAARRALLQFLNRVLSLDERRETIVVFDARHPPLGRPRVFVWSEITIEFAARGSQADDRIVELILDHSAPRQLTIVSSDRFIQREARRRHANAVDSDQWFRERLRAIPLSEAAGEQHQVVAVDEKPEGALSADEVRSWSARFGHDSGPKEPEQDTEADETRPAPPPDGTASQPKIWNPFPQGYGEDLLDE